MSQDSVYQKAIKKLDFGLVSKKTPVKADSFSKIRDVKKLQFNISFNYNKAGTNVVWIFTANLKAGYYAQVNYSISSAFRIFNYEELANTTAGSWQLSDNQYTLCVKFTKNGVVYRYKLRGNKTVVLGGKVVPTDVISQSFGSRYLSTINAPWYAGEKIEPDFVIEVWRPYQFTYPNLPNISQFNILISLLRNPNSLTETDPILYPIRTLQRVRYNLLPVYSLEIPFGGAFPVAFRDYSTGG